MPKITIADYYDLQYRCRRCGKTFNREGPHKEYGEEIPPFSYVFDEWNWTREQREQKRRHVNMIAEIDLPVTPLPDQFEFHKCNENETGLCDFVGWVNHRKVKISGHNHRKVID